VAGFCGCGYEPSDSRVAELVSQSDSQSVNQSVGRSVSQSVIQSVSQLVSYFQRWAMCLQTQYSTVPFYIKYTRIELDL
jgi:hypothetical protein